MILYQREKPYVPKYVNYDYVPVYNGNDKFVGWIKIWFSLKVRLSDDYIK